MADALRTALVAVTVAVALTLVAAPVAADDGLGSTLDGEDGSGDGGLTVEGGSDGVTVGVDGSGSGPNESSVDTSTTVSLDAEEQSVSVEAGGSGGVAGESAGGAVECELSTDTRENPCTTEGPGDGELPIEPPTEPPVEPPTQPPTLPPELPPLEPPTEPPVEPPTQPPIPVSSLQEVAALDSQLL